MIDYHIHTALCKHASGEMEEYVISAIQSGLEEMAFTDHIPLALPIVEECCMNRDELDSYVDSVSELRERFKSDIEIKLGLEADYIEGQEETVAEILEAYPFDVVLGSVHMMDGWAVDHPRFKYKYEEGSVLEIYRGYISHLTQAVKTGMYDIMAHPDLVKKMNYFPEEGDITEMFRDVIDVISEQGVCMELSSAGLRKPVHEQYPGIDLMNYAVEKRVPISTGSDAHKPEEVGADFDIMYSLLREAGVTSVCSFTQRSRTAKSL